jgi:ketosteroid isomerase-like protein
MRSIARFAFVLAVFGVTTPAKPADEPGPVLKSLIEAERNFSRTSVEKGIRPAFLANLADDAVLFRPDPVPGKKWLNDNPPDPGRLSWEPSYGEVSRSGDMGFTTGPYEYRGAGENPRIGYGHFVTVWKKQADGAWKVAIDFGAPHAKPEHREVLALRPGNGAKTERAKANVAAERARLLEADRVFADATERNSVEAYGTHAASDILFLRLRQQLVTGRDAVRKELEQKPGALTWKPVAADVSGSSDLGYTYGTGQFQSATANTPPHTGYYLRVWRREPKGPWKVALDLMVLVPRETQ